MANSEPNLTRVKDAGIERIQQLNSIKGEYQESLKEAILAKNAIFELKKQCMSKLERIEEMEKKMEASLNNPLIEKTFDEIIGFLKEHEKQKSIKQLIDELEEVESRAGFEKKHNLEAQKALLEAKALFIQAHQRLVESERILAALTLNGLTKDCNAIRDGIIELASF
eukprot:TRINITY_DN724_c0_g1_i1.p1 TRINITY_DN724_c0_g1~~TRINITY_DN724_c0_g1_i1.p1  ORF type:complete len:168 (-),score=57.09 TRINITY_DN724_c0_g1_i1:155-658(-)